MYSFKIESNAIEHYRPDKCPVLIWQIAETEAFVFFPDANNSGSVQFALFPISDLHPSTAIPEEIKNQSPLMSPEEVYSKYIQPRFAGISAECELVTNYPFTMNKQEKFVYDTLPNNPNIKIIDIGSAHGFKHAFAFGEQVAQHILTNQSELEIEKTFGSFFQDIEILLKQKKKPSL